MIVALELLAAFVLIVAGAFAFTNAVEWLGHRMNLGAGAVGALLAAVGTALPESVIPIVALLSGGGDAASVEIAIGAIVGAPFMLATIAMLLVTASAYAYRGRRPQGERIDVEPPAIRRDLVYFLILFPIGIALGAIGVPLGVRIAGAVVLVMGYGVYVWRTVKGAGGSAGDEDLEPLYFDTTKDDPPRLLQIAAQFVISLGAIILGAELFVGAIESVAESLGISLLLLALVLAPLATELPEKANSVLWVRQGKDMLALGNITGAMTFQSTIAVALGLVVTDWDLDPTAVVAGCVAVVGGLLAMFALPRGHNGLAFSAIWAGLFAGFVVYASVS